MAGFIERLHELPVDALGALVTESQQAGLRFVRRPVEEWVSGANRFDRRGEALFGLWTDGRLVGVCVVNVDPYSADTRVGRVRRPTEGAEKDSTHIMELGPPHSGGRAYAGHAVSLSVMTAGGEHA